VSNPEVSAPRQSALRTAFAGLIGNVLEWYDFAVFGFFSTEIGRAFFPDSSPAAQQLKAFAVFAVGFGARWIGSLVLGSVGDRIGRRALLTLSIALMGGATLLLGLLPSYATLGAAAPALLVLLRIIQGFSLGGEFTGSMVYTTELASPRTRGLISSSTAAGTTLGFILGSASVLLVNAVLGKQAAADWGWRLPFLASFVFVLAGWLLRRGIQESEAGEKAAAKREPLGPSLLRDWRAMVQTFGIVAMTNAAYYLTFTFAVERRKLGDDAGSMEFQRINTLVLIIVLFGKPLGGWLSDVVGRRRLMIALTLLQIVLVYFALEPMLYGSATAFTVGQLVLAIPLGMALGLQGAMVVEIFPLATRVTSMSLAYSITLVASGGIAPFVASALVSHGHTTAPVYYTIAYGVIGLALMIPMKETNQRSLV
jgi:MHS family proline/betaine transporter-like MFS transporter